jgi:hypothetical protein
MSLLTLDTVVKVVPANLKGSITQQLVDNLNNIAQDPIMADAIRDNFISYTGVLREGRFKTEDYLHAVMYVSYKLMGDSNQEAYVKTFPARYTALVAAGRTPKDIAAYVSMYNKGKLVNLILEQSLVPTHILNAHVFQQAINTQVELMTDVDVSPKVRSDAANSLLTHLKKPDAKAELNINIGEQSGMNDLRAALEQLAAQQQQAISGGHATVKEIAHTPIIEGEAKVVE